MSEPSRRAVIVESVNARNLSPQGQRPGADDGDPQLSAEVIATDERSGTVVGVWTCTPGGWPVESRANTEVAHILAGRATITDSDGQGRIVGPGDVVVLPVGWSGRWDVVDEVRKVYTLVDEQPH